MFLLSVEHNHLYQLIDNGYSTVTLRSTNIKSGFGEDNWRFRPHTGYVLYAVLSDFEFEIPLAVIKS